MGCVVRSCGPKHEQYRVFKGQLDARPSRWIITIWYDVPEEELGENECNPRRVVVKVAKPCWLSQLGPILDSHVSEDKGTNVRWQALQER